MPNEIMPNVFNSPFVKNTFTRLDNWINPIVVKEMRQAVRSRYIILLLQIYLALQALMTCSAFLLSDLTDLSDGKELFSMLTILLFLVNLCCVPVYTSNRLWKEVQQGDAMFTSTLTPLQIVRGKFFSGMTISLLLFSAAAPFVMLTYLMRGLDMSEILLSLYGLFLSIQVLNSMGIAFGTLKCSPLIRAILGFGCGITFIGILGNGPSGFFHLFSSMDVSGFIIATCLSLFLCEIFQLLATCILAPLSHNRMTRPRIFITASSILLVIISGIITILTSNDSFFNGCCTCIFFLMVLFLTVGLCERTTLSPRQIQQIPSNILLRIIYFPFFTGAGSAIAWFFTMMLFMYSFTYLFFCTLYSFGFGMSVENPFYLISTLVFIRYEGGIFWLFRRLVH